MTHDLKITLAQLNPTVGDLDGNIDKIRDVRDAHLDSDLIIFPEMIVTGYPCDDLLNKPSFIEAVAKLIKILSKESKEKPALLIGTPWKDGDILYNAAILISDGEIQNTIYKHKLPNEGVFDEKRYFVEAPLQKPILFKGLSLGIMICEDLWAPETAQHLKDLNAEILIVLNGSPFHTEISDLRHFHAKKRIHETNIPLLYINQVGGQDDLIFDGSSFAMDNVGNITHQLPACEENIYTLLFSDIIKKLENHHDTPIEETLYKAVTLGLKDYVQKNGFNGVLLGLSGGIDSALSAAIAVDALGAKNVHCIMMPSPYTSQESLDDAQKCAKLLGVQLDTIPIDQAMTAYDAMLKDHIDKNEPGTTFENIQSRARGIILMALSNASGKMVLSTGNKSEVAVGYATLYGDMCGGYNALKDLYKTQVYKLAAWRNIQNTVIPDRILTKAPSAELKPDQTDQDSLPPYDILDDILECLIEREMAITDIPHDPDIVLKVSRMLKLAEYKRRQAPPGPKVTPKALGRDRRYPITNGYKEI